jgi:hypothetical protein
MNNVDTNETAASDAAQDVTEAAHGAFAAPHATASSPMIKSKVLAGLLAFYGGWFGAHWYYLGRRRPWLLTLLAVVMLTIALQSPVWWDSPALFIVFIPAVAGFIEALVLCLMPDEKFDARYNPGYQRVGHTGWGPVLVSISGLLIGTVLTLFGLAHVILHIWVRLGWLDGLNL